MVPPKCTAFGCTTSSIAAISALGISHPGIGAGRPGRFLHVMELMSISLMINNELVMDDAAVWRLKGHDAFAYSDGASSEIYLEKVFRTAKDLGSRSNELQGYIRDWPSEYHLSIKRAQLLSGFSFDRSMKVLEVGCGCGAITRYLGETFDNVVSIEGSPARARLAQDSGRRASRPSRSFALLFRTSSSRKSSISSFASAFSNTRHRSLKATIRIRSYCNISRTFLNRTAFWSSQSRINLD